MTEQAQAATKQCRQCSAAKPLVAFAGRQNTCIACRDAAKARALERKEQVAWSPALGERITDMLAAGMAVTEVCGQSAMPTPRQLRAWRRANPDFDAACDEALAQSAAAHLDKAKEVLVKLEDGKLPSADAKALFDGHMKLAATLNPARYGTHATVDVTSAGRPLVDFGSAIEALIASLPAAGALPAPTPIDAESSEVPEGATLQ